MLPLPEPEFQKGLGAKPGLVEAHIALGANKWGNTLCDDEGKTGESQDLQHENDDRRLPHPVRGECGNVHGFEHGPSLSAAWPAWLCAGCADKDSSREPSLRGRSRGRAIQLRFPWEWRPGAAGGTAHDC